MLQKNSPKLLEELWDDFLGEVKGGASERLWGAVVSGSQDIGAGCRQT